MGEALFCLYVVGGQEIEVGTSTLMPLFFFRNGYGLLVIGGHLHVVQLEPCKGKRPESSLAFCRSDIFWGLFLCQMDTDTRALVNSELSPLREDGGPTGQLQRQRL